MVAPPPDPGAREPPLALGRPRVAKPVAPTVHYKMPIKRTIRHYPLQMPIKRTSKNDCIHTTDYGSFVPQEDKKTKFLSSFPKSTEI
jgi:hypothetical protein